MISKQRMNMPWRDPLILYVIICGLSLMMHRDSQYKKNFPKSGIGKNIKSSEMRWIIKKERERRTEENKSTAFLVRGQEVDPTKIKRYKTRNKLRDSEALSPAAGKNVCSALNTIILSL